MPGSVVVCLEENVFIWQNCKISQVCLDIVTRIRSTVTIMLRLSGDGTIKMSWIKLRNSSFHPRPPVALDGKVRVTHDIYLWMKASCYTTAAAECYWQPLFINVSRPCERKSRSLHSKGSSSESFASKLSLRCSTGRSIVDNGKHFLSSCNPN